MLDINEIDTAIAELEANKTTFANCSKLATLYTVRDHADRNNRAYEAVYSRAVSPIMEVPETMGRYGNSDFLRAVEGKDLSAIFNIIDELLTTLQAVNKRVYDNVMLQISRI